MIQFIKTKLIAIGIILISMSFADNYSISIYFEQPEEALNTLLRTEVLPHPIGNHDGNDYDIYVWNPNIDIESNVVNISFTVYANAVIGGTPIQFDYPFILPLNIPEGELSISGIISYLEGIPAQIDSMDGPQWIKDIIIAEYEGLELTVYPNSLLEGCNASIPDFVDLTVNNITFTWEALTDLLQFSLIVDIEGNPPDIDGQWYESNGNYSLRFNSNVSTDVLYIGIYNVWGQSSENENVNISLSPDEWSNGIGMAWGNNIPSGQYRCKVLFGSEYGWFAVYYVFNNLGDSGWNPMVVTQTM